MSDSSANLRLTRHAEARLQQRAIREADLDLLIRCGSAIGNAVMMTDRDVRREVDRLKHHIGRLERLRGVKAIIEAGALVTIYRERRSKAKPRRLKPDSW